MAAAYKPANDPSVHPTFLEVNQALLFTANSSWPKPLKLVFKPRPQQSGSLQWETLPFDLMSDYSSQHVVLFRSCFFSKTNGSLLLRRNVISVAKDFYLAGTWIVTMLSLTM